MAVLDLDAVTHDEAISVPCLRCYSPEGSLCCDEHTGLVTGVTHIERTDMAARFYQVFMEGEAGDVTDVLADEMEADAVNEKADRSWLGRFGL